MNSIAQGLQCGHLGSGILALLGCLHGTADGGYLLGGEHRAACGHYLLATGDGGIKGGLDRSGQRGHVGCVLRLGERLEGPLAVVVNALVAIDGRASLCGIGTSQTLIGRYALMQGVHLRFALYECDGEGGLVVGIGGGVEVPARCVSIVVVVAVGSLDVVHALSSLLELEHLHQRHALGLVLQLHVGVVALYLQVKTCRHVLHAVVLAGEQAFGLNTLHIHRKCYIAEGAAHGSGGGGVHGVEACLTTRGILGYADGDGHQCAITESALLEAIEHDEQVARSEGADAHGMTLGSTAQCDVASEGEALGEREVKLQGGHLRCALNGYGDRSFLSCLSGDVRHGEALCHRATYDKRQHGKYA